MRNRHRFNSGTISRALFLVGLLSCGGDSGSGPTPDPDPVATSISVTPNPAQLIQGGSLQLAGQILDQNGDPMSGTVTFSSLDDAVLTSSSNGLLTSVGRATSTVVLAETATLQENVVVTIAPVPKEVRINVDTMTLGSTGTKRIQALVYDLADDVVPGLTPTLASQDPSLITVLPGSRIQSVGPTGNTTVSATYSTFSDTLDVTILRGIHPQGVLVKTLNTSSESYDVATSRSRPAYVTLWPGGTQVNRVDLLSSALLPSIPGTGPALSVEFNHAGTTAYIAQQAGPSSQAGVAKIDVASGTVTGSIPINTAWAVAVSPDDQLVYVGTNLPKLFILDAVTLSIVDSISIPVPAARLAVHPTLPLLYASGPGEPVEINMTTRTVTRSFPSGSSTQAVAISPDGTELYAVTEFNILSIFDVASGNLILNVPGAGGFGSAISPDGQRLYVVGGYNIKIVNPLTRTLLDSIVVAGASNVSFTFDGGTALVAGGSNGTGQIHVIE
jgi:hypothetical protein